MFEQSFKNIDDILRKDAGCGSELDYVEQTSWVLFLKYLDDLEKDKENAALLPGAKRGVKSNYFGGDLIRF
jgi:type I restriction enzyme M protein